MYKSIREKSWYDMQDTTKHEYTKNETFPFDGREVKESRLVELSSDLNKLNEPLIKMESELLSFNKKDIQDKFDEEEFAYEKNDSKETLIINYEYENSRKRLLEEVNELGLEITNIEDMPNLEIVKLILESQK